MLLRQKIAKFHGVGEPEVDRVLVELTANAIWRELGHASPAPDSGDDHLWALLAAHDDSILITADRLLQRKPPAASRVIFPSAWVEIVAR